MTRAPSQDLPAPASPRQPTREQFLVLLCADEGLLRAGFDAIIAAEWPTPLPARQGPGVLARTSPRAQPRHCGPNRVGPTIPASAGGFDSGHVRTPTGTYRARKAGDAPREATLTR
jgi:hypothetical protein